MIKLLILLLSVISLGFPKLMAFDYNYDGTIVEVDKTQSIEYLKTHFTACVEYSDLSYEFMQIPIEYIDDVYVGYSLKKYDSVVVINDVNYEYEFVNGTIKIINRLIITPRTNLELWDHYDDGKYLCYDMGNYIQVSNGAYSKHFELDDINTSDDYIDRVDNYSFYIYIHNYEQVKFPGRHKIYYSNGNIADDGLYILISCSIFTEDFAEYDYYYPDYLLYPYDEFDFASFSEVPTPHFVADDQYLVSSRIDSEFSTIIDFSSLLKYIDCFEDSLNSDTLVRLDLLRVKDGYQVSVDDCPSVDINLYSMAKTLLIDKNEFYQIYNLSDYDNFVRIKSLEDLNKISGVGKVIIEKSKTNYLYTLLQKDSTTAYQILFDDFLPDLAISDIKGSCYINIGDKIYFEFITNDDISFVYCPNDNTIETKKNIIISSTDHTVEYESGYYSYYLYFNSDIDVDFFTRIATSVSYHKETKAFFGDKIIKYDYSHFVFDITPEDTEIDTTEMNNRISKFLFCNDPTISKNLTKGNYIINGNNYSFRMRYLISSLDYYDFNLIMQTLGHLRYTIENADTGFILIDEVTPLNCDYVYQDVFYSNVIVESDIVIDDTPSDDPYNPNHVDINHWDLVSFIKLLFDGELSEAFSKYWGGAIIFILIILSIIFLIKSLISVFVQKIFRL